METQEIVVRFSEGNLLLLNFCLALIMFGVSLDLRPKDFKDILTRPATTILGIVIQYVLLPILTLGIVAEFQPTYGIALGILLVMVSPGGNMSNFLTKIGRGDVPLSVALTAITTILSAFMTPLLFNLYSGFIDGDAEQLKSLDIWEMTLIVLQLTALPLLAGMAVNYYAPQLARKLESPLKKGSLLIFFLFIIMAFIKNKEAFVNHIGLVFGLVAIVNAVALGVGYFLPKLLKAGETQSRAVSIEAGIKNSALSLVLVFNFWDGWGEPALVAAWWGIWHLLSGFIIAIWWSKR